MNEKANYFRLLFAGLLAILAVVAGINFSRYVSSPTDENWFRNPPSKLYITKSFPVVESEVAATGGEDEYVRGDSIKIGDLLLQMNWTLITEPKAVQEVLQAEPEDSMVSMLVFRPRWDKAVAAKVLKKAIPANFFRAIPPAVHVFDVFSGGASERAGMEKGDLIFRINGSTFNNQTEADLIMRRARAGKTIAYDIIRDNKTITLQVTLARIGISLSALFFFLSGLLFLGTGGFILIARPWLKAARLLGLALTATGFFIMVLPVQRVPQTDVLTLVRNIFLTITLYFSFALFAHSKLYFPAEWPALSKKRWVVFTPYAIAVVGLVAFSLFNRALLIFGFLAVLLLSMLFSGVVEFIHRKTKSLEYKKLNRIIFYTNLMIIGIGIGGGVYMNKQYQQIGFLGFLLAFMPLAYLYTIGRYKLFDLNLRVRRNIQYTIVSALWSLIVIAAVLFMLFWLSALHTELPNIFLTETGIEIADTPLSAGKHLFFEKIIFMSAAILLAAAARRVMHAGQKIIDRMYYRTSSNYGRAANELAEVMGTNLSMVDLAKGIAEKLAGAMLLKRAGVLFFRNEETCCCQEAHGFDGDRWSSFCLRVNHQLLGVFTGFRSESRFSVDYLPQELKNEFLSESFRYIFIIRSKEKLVGALLIGEKRAEAPFHYDDLEFLSTIAKQAAVSIENAFLYERLTEQERLKHELEIARHIQLASLPQQTPVMKGLDIDGISIPALEVGGDYFDYLNGDTHEITVIVGDVSGKGTSAALYMSKMQGIFRSLHGFHLSPREFFIRANHLLSRDMEKKSFVTVIGGFFNTQRKELCLARAGHLPLYYFNARKARVEELKPRGLGLGIDRDHIFAAALEEEKIEFDKGDIFLFITDGIVEAHNKNGDEFGEARLIEILNASRALSPLQIRQKILASLDAFTKETYQHDDQTLVVVKIS